MSERRQHVPRFANLILGGGAPRPQDLAALCDREDGARFAEGWLHDAPFAAGSMDAPPGRVSKRCVARVRVTCPKGGRPRAVRRGIRESAGTVNPSATVERLCGTVAAAALQLRANRTYLASRRERGHFRISPRGQEYCRTEATMKGKTSAKGESVAEGNRGTVSSKKRRKRRAVATPYQQLMGELLRLKEEFLKRNREYAAEVQELCEQLPSNANRREWTEEDRRRLEDFVWKWDTIWASPEDLRDHPYGGDHWIWDEGYGVVGLSGPESDLVVIGIDVRHDAEEIAEFARELVRDVRRFRQQAGEPEHRWKPFRWKSRHRTLKYPEPFDRRSVTRFNVHYWEGGLPEEGEQAIRAWDMRQRNVPEPEIRNYLFPDSADLPAGDKRWRWVDERKVPESALKRTQRRLRKARAMVEGGYRQILPLTGIRSRLEAIRQWEVSCGYGEEVRTRKGGASRVLKGKERR